MILIRPEAPEHAAGVYQVEKLAFDRAAEADLCERLRARSAVTLSLVALDEGEVIGHVLFSPVTIRGEQGELRAEGMGPVSVLPGRQNQGVGSRLVRAGLEELRQSGVQAVVVLGDPRYYSRFGFEPAARHGITFPNLDPAHTDAFQIIEFRRGCLIPGVAIYEPEFNEV